MNKTETKIPRSIVIASDEISGKKNWWEHQVMIHNYHTKGIIVSNIIIKEKEEIVFEEKNTIRIKSKGKWVSKNKFTTYYVDQPQFDIYYKITEEN